MKHPALTIVAGRVARLWADEAGGEVVEYALILGMILVVCIAVIAGFGTKVLARWTSVNRSV